MSITKWPKEDRPREKLLLKGEKTLTDAELIAIFLNSGPRGKTALDLARELLHEYGGLKKLLQAPPNKLIQKKGVGNAKYACLKAAVELGQRFASVSFPQGAQLKSSQAVQLFLSQQLKDLPHEVFSCLFLDNHFHLISFEQLFQGTINEASVYPREIVRRGMAHNAAKIILAHNHPSGHPSPSPADKTLTLLIKQALSLVDIEVVDHIIIGRWQLFSFAEAGLL